MASEASWRNRPLGWTGTRRQWDRLVYLHGVDRADQIAQLQVVRRKRALQVAPRPPVPDTSRDGPRGGPRTEPGPAA